MTFRILCAVGSAIALTYSGRAQIPVLKPSDVTFMYQAPRSVYETYGATVLAWGGTPTPESLQTAAGIRFFGSVGMVTEFARYYERFPTNYEQGLCRDLEGKPFKVPWLTDHNHKGVPFWWCCTRQPVFRQYISERVIETVKSGAYGVHIDDHLGTAGSLFLGGCFCDLCVKGFPAFLKQTGNSTVADIEDYRTLLRAFLAEKAVRKVSDHPLWETWRVYQLRGAAQFMSELKDLAAKTGARPVPMSANACLLWGPHLSDYMTLDFFSAEIDHHASARQLSAVPVVAYRIADAVGRPLASTASGGDWAFIKASGLDGLVRSWIALGYAAGNCIMAPNHQWCYTPEKGTHWYEGPTEQFAPLYRFVREHADLFDGYQNHADLMVVYSQKTYDREPGVLMNLCDRLLKENVSYRLELGGDAVVDRPLSLERLREAKRAIILRRKDFNEADARVLDQLNSQQCFEEVEKALQGLSPAVQLDLPGKVRLFPRSKPGGAVIHLINWDYDAEKDSVRTIPDVSVKLNLQALGVEGAATARWLVHGQEPKVLTIDGGKIVVPELSTWGVLELKKVSR
jgi:hypothetical protein